MHIAISERIQHAVTLAPLTSIRLGGPAASYIACESKQDIADALAYAREQDLRIHILGGGSNTIFPDAGFDGLIIHILTKGIIHENTAGNTVMLTAQAGENWDNVVQYAINHNLAGIECLSGIPGSCGGTPYQNVGAYGQDVSETIDRVHAIERSSMASVHFSNASCEFGYRTSRFKTKDRDAYIITEVTFKLTQNGKPSMKYPELAQEVGDTVRPGKEGLLQVREAVLALRKKKSMLLDPTDPNSVSCGSFFTNPIMSMPDFASIPALATSDIPHFPAGSAEDSTLLIKLSAGWLIAHAGFAKGMKSGNVGISEHHNLALVNNGGTTQELLAFAKTIQTAVMQQFGVQLEMEPIVVQ